MRFPIHIISILVLISVGCMRSDDVVLPEKQKTEVKPPDPRFGYFEQARERLIFLTSEHSMCAILQFDKNVYTEGPSEGIGCYYTYYDFDNGYVKHQRIDPERKNQDYVLDYVNGSHVCFHYLSNGSMKYWWSDDFGENWRLLTVANSTFVLVPRDEFPDGDILKSQEFQGGTKLYKGPANQYLGLFPNLFPLNIRIKNNAIHFLGNERDSLYNRIDGTYYSRMDVSNGQTTKPVWINGRNLSTINAVNDHLTIIPDSSYLYRSEDGIHWYRNRNVPNDVTEGHVYHFPPDVDGQSGSVGYHVFRRKNNGLGIYRSDDIGESWEMSSAHILSGEAAFMPLNSMTFGLIDNNAIYLTRNRGQSWKLMVTK